MPIVYATFEDMKGAQRESDLVQLADVATVAEAQSFIEKKLVEAGTIIDSYVASKYGDRAGLPVPARRSPITAS